MIDQYVPNLKKYRAIALDCSFEDGLVASNKDLDQATDSLGRRPPISFENLSRRPHQPRERTLQDQGTAVLLREPHLPARAKNKVNGAA
jgi:hypothetical protein